MATKAEVWRAIRDSGDDVLIEGVRAFGQTFGLDWVDYGGLIWERGYTGERDDKIR